MKFVVISALLFFSYYAYSAEPSDSTPLAEKIYKDISDIINDEKLTLTSKIDKLETSLTAAKSYISANQFAILFAKAEPILILDADNPTTTVYQIIFLISQFQNSEIWVFSEPRERVTTRIISLKENALKNAAISEVDASVKNQLEGAVNMFLANELSSQGRFEEADKSFDELFKSIEGSGSLYPQIKYVCSQIKLKSLLARGDLKGALDLSNQLDDQFDSMVDFIRQSKHPRFNNEDISMLSASFQVDMFLGKYDEVIRKGSWLLSLMPREDGNLKLMKNKAELLKNLALAYEKKGNEELATDFNKQAEILDAKTDYVDFPVLFKKFFNAMHDKNYEYAKNVIEKIKVFFSKAYPFANEIEKSIFEKITMEQSRYVQSEMIEFKKPLKECKSIDCLNVNQKISELREEIDRTNDETAKVFLAKYLVLLDKFVDIEIKKNDLNRMGMHMTKIAPFLEEIYFLGIQDGTLRVSDQLDLLISLHDYYVISDKQYAAYFARTYINKLQKIRGQLKLINDQDLQYFTEAQSDTLKKFSKTFFDIGEPESALLCLKIIKQNEFYDFVKRGTLSEGY